MHKYEIIFHDGRTEVVDGETALDVSLKADSCEIDDVSQVNEIDPDGKLVKTIWTDEEGFSVGN